MTRYRRIDTVVAEAFGDQLLVLDTTTGRSVVLNRSAQCVWEALGRTDSPAGVAAALADRFAIDPARAARDADVAVATLVQHGFVIVGQKP